MQIKQFITITCTWQFNSYSTIISGVNSLLFWKIGCVTASGVHLPIIKSPVHHSIGSPLFFRKIVGRYGRPSWIGKARLPLLWLKTEITVRSSKLSLYPVDLTKK